MDIKEQIISIVAECLEVEKESINPSMDLYDMDEFDSMRNVMILAKIEDSFDVIIPEDDLFEISNINEWVAEIKKLIE